MFNYMMQLEEGWEVEEEKTTRGRLESTKRAGNFAGSTTAMAMGGTTLVHCGPGGEDRPSHLAIPSGGGLPPSLNAALSSSLNSNLGSIGAAAATAASWPPTLWQYPAAAAAAAAAAAGEFAGNHFFLFFNFCLMKKK